METRMERFAKYRESIRRMAPEEFAAHKVGNKEAEAVNEAVLPDFSTNFDGGIQSDEGTTTSGPYSLYLKRRKRWLVVKLVCFAVVAAIFVVWWFLMQGRK